MTQAVELPKEMPARMTVDEWNDVWFLRVTLEPSGSRGHLMIYQTMKGIVSYNGVRYRVVGWAPPGPDKPFVEASKIVPPGH